MLTRNARVKLSVLSLRCNARLLSHQVTLALRREDPSRIWERRTPLSPDGVKEIIRKKDVRILVESCARRTWSDLEYVQAGAQIVDSLKDPQSPQAHIVMGIKEPPLTELTDAALNGTEGLDSRIVPRTYLMFSHTTKAQPYNMPLLAKFLRNASVQSDPIIRPRLIDYELITDEHTGARTVGFGFFAGLAGALESFSSMALSHLERGIASPFLYTPRPHISPSLSALRADFREHVGDLIRQRGTPRELGAFIVGVTGNGKVSKGMLSMLEELPIEDVGVDDLPKLVGNPDVDRTKVYLYHAQPKDYLVRQDGQPFERSHYYANPAKYESVFADKVAPYLTLLLNGVGWQPGFPRLMTNESLTRALTKAQPLGGLRFENIGDVSCDVNGGLEFLPSATTLSEPAISVRPEGLPEHLPSVRMMAVDILPTSIPSDASLHFQTVLMPYLEALVDEYTSVKGADAKYTDALKRATIADGGALTKDWKWLGAEVEKSLAETTKSNEEPLVDSDAIQRTPIFKERGKRVVMFGSGMVAKPAVDTLAARSDIQLCIASNVLADAEKLAAPHPNAEAKLVSFSDEQAVDALVQWSDLVISLLPASFHPKVAELCLNHRKHLVTASYISPDMAKLNKRAMDADVLLLNEIGLDPGIDHCSAVSLISRLHAEEKEVVSFTSFCGGLPAPDVPRVPLRYKFSWSPRGVLAAACNSAHFKVQNKEVKIPQEDLLKSYFPNLPVTHEFALEGIANRDSLPYAQTYDLPSAPLRTIMRGTLRYPGFSNLMNLFKMIGLLESQKQIVLRSWHTLVFQAMALKGFMADEDVSEISTLRRLWEAIHSNAAENAELLLEALDWFSLLPLVDRNFQTSLPPLPKGPITPMDALAILLTHKLAYEPHERDLVVLHHEVLTRSKRNPDQPEEKHTSSLVTYGDSEASAMAKTVGLPVGIAALRVLDGVDARGVVGPTDPSVWKPVLEGLEELGVKMVEKTERVSQGGSETIEQVVGRKVSELSSTVI